MPFSMHSYLLGVGTVVGALVLGFGGGVLLTKTAIKDSAAGPSRVERMTRSEPLPGAASAPQVSAAVAQVPRTDSPAVQPVSEPVRQILASTEPAKPVAETPRAEPVRAAETVRPQAAGQVEAIRQIEQNGVEQWRSPRDQRRAEREQRRMDRRIERERRYMERRARTQDYARMRERPVDEQEQVVRSQLAFEREEPRPAPQANPFEGLFGRSTETAPANRD